MSRRKAFVTPSGISPRGFALTVGVAIGLASSDAGSSERWRASGLQEPDKGYRELYAL